MKLNAFLLSYISIPKYYDLQIVYNKQFKFL